MVAMLCIYPGCDKSGHVPNIPVASEASNPSSKSHSDVAYTSIDSSGPNTVTLAPKSKHRCPKFLRSPWFYGSTGVFLTALIVGLYVYSQSKLKPIDIERLEAAKCPACFGQSACPQFFRGDVRIPTMYGSRPLHARDFASTGDMIEVDLGMIFRKPAILRRLAFPNTSMEVDAEVCRRQRRSDLSEDVAVQPRCVPHLSIWRWMATSGPGTSDPIDKALIRTMTASTQCGSEKLLQLMKSRFRERSSNPNLPPQSRWLRFDELTLLFNLVINPHAVIGQTFPANEGWPFPVQLGACGRMTLEKGTAQTLSEYVDAPLKVRLQILRSLLKLPSKLIANATFSDRDSADFALYLGDYRWDVFGVDPHNLEVSILQARHILVVDLMENPKSSAPFIINPNATYIRENGCQDDYDFAASLPCLSSEHASRLCESNLPSDHNHWSVCMTALAGDRVLVRDAPRDLIFSLEQCVSDAQEGARQSHIGAALEVIGMELGY